MKAMTNNNRKHFIMKKTTDSQGNDREIQTYCYYEEHNIK